MRVAGIQIDIALGQPEVNREKVAAMIRTAAAKGAGIVVLPEMWNTGYALERLEHISDTAGEPSKALLGTLAKELGIDIIGGSVASQENGKFYNHSLVINRRGQLVHTYEKVHLFRLMDEEKYLQPGKEAKPFSLAGARWGLIICYDLRFPELSRKLAVAGAEVLVVPAQWPKTRLYHWRSLLVARAIENQQYVVAVNRVGFDDKNEFAGHSMVVDPLGEVLYEAGEKEVVFMVDMDMDKVAAVRRSMPVFADRSPECY